jgi:hypothetical protein
MLINWEIISLVVLLSLFGGFCAGIFVGEYFGKRQLKSTERIIEDLERRRAVNRRLTMANAEMRRPESPHMGIYDEREPPYGRWGLRPAAPVASVAPVAPAAPASAIGYRRNERPTQSDALRSVAPKSNGELHTDYDLYSDDGLRLHLYDGVETAQPVNCKKSKSDKWGDNK